MRPNVIPQEALRAALCLVQSQDEIPESPGRAHADGTVTLCTAACLAHAALWIRAGSHHDCDQFRSAILNGGSKSVVRNVFESVGWSAEWCDKLMSDSDKQHPSRRREWALGYFMQLLNQGTSNNSLT